MMCGCPLGIEHDVLGLQVAMNDARFVSVMESLGDFSK
jgi:hypothetical protein